jgi:hypothetical protein
VQVDLLRQHLERAILGDETCSYDTFAVSGKAYVRAIESSVVGLMSQVGV